MSKMIIFFMSFLSLGLVTAATIENFNVVIYSEYYYSGVVVEYSWEVSESDAANSIRIRLPVEIDSVLSIQDTGEQKRDIRKLNPEMRAGENWIFTELNQTSFQILVFFTPYSEKQGKRDLTYVVETDRDLSDLHVVVQKPLGANNFTLSAQDAETFTDQHGLEFYRFHLPNLNANSTNELNMTYENPSGVTTMEMLQNMLKDEESEGGNSAAVLQPKAVPVRHRLLGWEPLLALLLLSVFVVVIYRRNQRTSSMSDDALSFCSGCGTELKPGDNFCNKCGKKV